MKKGSGTHSVMLLVARVADETGVVGLMMTAM
jgi:hypothetical protein